jgi:putative SOS response-associated peptidase YedK
LKAHDHTTSVLRFFLDSLTITNAAASFCWGRCICRRCAGTRPEVHAQPFLFEIDGGKPFAFAGLWVWWRDPKAPDGAALESCVLITTDANEVGAEVHNRMPLILDAANYDAWLDPANETRPACNRCSLSSRLTE